MSTPVAIPDLIASACVGLHSKAALWMAVRSGTCETLTYGELGRAAYALALRLRADGLSPGDRVGLMSENRPLWAAAYLGILAAGGVCVPIDARARGTEVREMLGHCRARALIHSGRTASAAGEGAQGLENEINMISIEVLERSSEGPALGWSLAPRDPDSEAAIIYTSGTMGRPKGVRLSHRNIVSNVTAMKRAVPVRGDDVFLSVLPLNHTFECTAGLLVPLSAGASIAYAPSLKPRELHETLVLTRPTVMLGVPLLYEKLLAGIYRALRRSPPARRATARALLKAAGALGRAFGPGASRALTSGVRRRSGLDRMRYMISGAAAMPRSVYDGFESLGLTLIQGYGLTEASPVVAVNPPNDPRVGTAGVPLPQTEVAIDTGRGGEVGEVLVRGEGVMLGYLGDPGATAEVMCDGWLRTGDLGWVDRDGHLHISGRCKNVIVTSAGKKVYPEEIEALLLESFCVEEAVVLGRRPGVGRGEQPWAIIRPDRDRIAVRLGRTPGELDPGWVREIVKAEIRHISSNLADYKKLRGFTIREEEFPRSGSGKVKRYLLHEDASRARTGGGRERGANP